MSTSAVTFTSADGIGVTVPAGAFDVATVVRVEPAQESVFSGVPRVSDELRMSAAVTVTFDGRARRPLELKLPALAGAGLNRAHFLGILGQSSRGPRIMAVDPLLAVSGALTTERPSSGTRARIASRPTPSRSRATTPATYVQWCIGELPDRERLELEELTPELRRFYPHPGHWYEIMEAEWDLSVSGRAIIKGSFEEMADEVTPEEFTVEWVQAFFRGIKRMNKRQQNHAWRKAATRQR